MSNRSPMPIFLLRRSISPDIMVMIPRPPICIRSNITICPNTLQVDTVGSVTSPVTQVEVVAVKSASRYGTASPLAELIGNAKSPLPMRMVTRKLSNMICVVESVNFLFLTIRFSSKKHEGTNVLCSQLVPLLSLFFMIISYLAVYVNIFHNTTIAIYTTNWNLSLSQFEKLFLYYFLAPSAFVAFRTLQIPCRSPMHRIKCLLIGRYDLVAAIFALISPHADFKL